MSGIAGIARQGKVAEVTGMLDLLAHRGEAGLNVIETGNVCLGAVSSVGKRQAWDASGALVRDETGPGHYARALALNGGFELSRDPIGVAPLYYGRTHDGALCFASEVKALLSVSDEVHELPPGSRYDGNQLTQPTPITAQSPLNEPPEKLAALLRAKLEAAVERCVARGGVGSWLSGGLDSSAMVALARPLVGTLHTFAGGLSGASDLQFAREVAIHTKTQHHEVILSLETLRQALPEVIAALESFDALLVRSSVVNYLVGKAASGYVNAVFSGEGGDELFGGYAYLKELPIGKLANELVDITGRLHNTALQRVDRSASSHGLTAHVCFLDPEVVELAFQIPSEYKIRNGMEKWILRKALAGLLPESVLERPKAKFWEGAGVESLLSEYAEGSVTDADFNRERRLPNDWILNSKEELMYYRLFKDRLGEMQDLSWMGRTKKLGPRMHS
jgi:asparagine synthase (glutamine-hydrolysing)